MRRRSKIFPVLVLLFMIVACGLITIHQLDQDIAVMEDRVKETEIALRARQSQQSTLETEVNSKDSSAYIIEHARAMGYLMPGEIRFVVTNPDALYDVPQAIVVDQNTGEEMP